MPNPFFFAGKITNLEQFVGRKKELQKIFGYLEVTHTNQIQHVSVVGERRIGKSSLLYHVSKVPERYLQSCKLYRFGYIDLDHPHCHTMHGFLQYTLKSLDLPVPAQLDLERFYEITEDFHATSGIWPILLIDEFEHLSKRNTEFTDSFYEGLRSLGNNNIVGIVTASQHPLQDLAEQGKLTSPFFNIFHQMELKEFSDSEANDLLSRGRSSDHPFTMDDCHQILKIAGKNPARLQIVSSLVYEVKANETYVNWKSIKTEALKDPPFSNHYRNQQKTKNVLLKSFTWLFWHVPQYIGHAIMVLIGRGEHTNDTTDRLIGYLTVVIVLALLAGVIPWPLVTKAIRRFSDWFMK